MRRTFIGGLILAILLVGAVGAARAGENNEKIEKKEGVITVSGKVRTFAKADRATVSFKIRGLGKSLSDAFDDAGGKMDKIAARLAKIGIKENELATSFFQSEENEGNKAFLSSKRDYRTVMMASVTTKQLDLLKGVLITLSEMEVEEISDVSFELTNYEELRKDALEQAMKRAHEKLNMICGEFGAEPARIIEAVESATAPRTEPKLRQYPNPFNSATYSLSEPDAGMGGVFPEEFRFDTEVRLVVGLKDELVTP